MLALGCARLLAEEPAALPSARTALQESLPQIAAQKLETFLSDKASPPEARDEAQLLLATALLQSGRFEEALASISPLAARGVQGAQLLKAHILAAAGRWQEALPLYRQAAERGGGVTAKWGQAECLEALGQANEAAKILDGIVREAPENPTAKLRLASISVTLGELDRARKLLAAVSPATSVEQKWKRYVEAHLLQAGGDAEQAGRIFQEIIDAPAGVSQSLLAGATMGESEARIVLKGYEAGEKPLESFVRHHDSSPWLEMIFRQLDQVYTHDKSPDESNLHEIAARPLPRSAALARFYVSRLQIRKGKLEKAAISLEAFVERYPEHPLLPYVYLMQADLLLEKADLEAAVRTLDAAERAVKNPAQRGEIELRRGLVLYQQGQFLLAENEFRRAAEHSPVLRENATFNAALAALQQKNYARFLEDYRTLEADFSTSPLRGELLLEEGLTQVRNGDEPAAEKLKNFLRKFPRAPRQAEARLALAEQAYAARDARAAAEYLRVVNTAPVEPKTTEQADYLAVFVAEAQSPPDERKVVEQAQAFIRRYPKSPLLADVRMKVGQIYFQRGDFAGAETQFTILAGEAPESEYAEPALFLAGQAAMKSMSPGAVDRALKLFDEVVSRSGPLKLYARQQQAIVQGTLGKEFEAVTIYDLIIGATPPPELELHCAALAGKGENLLLLGRKDAKAVEIAAAVFGDLAALPEAPPAWRNQALYKKATALLQLGRDDDALATYYQVLEKGVEPPREYFWYYKAGFDLANLFKEKSNWKSAIGVYEKMARVEGPRAEDARALARELRLTHFIWE